jgi:hypothetical protein
VAPLVQDTAAAAAMAAAAASAPAVDDTLTDTPARRPNKWATRTTV